MNESQKFFISRIEDLIKSVLKGRFCSYTRFLSVEEQLLVRSISKSNKVCVKFYGGYSDAQRRIACLYDGDELENFNFPLQALSFSCERLIGISHRDVLGSLMSLGIKRETVGDIIFVDNICIMFVDTDISDYVLHNLVSVKNYGISLGYYDGEVEYTHNYDEFFAIVSSMRLDCIVSELSSSSRTNANAIIESGAVFINGIQCVKRDKLIVLGDVLTVRRYGKYIIKDIVGKTKKDRFKLLILKYI